MIKTIGAAVVAAALTLSIAPAARGDDGPRRFVEVGPVHCGIYHCWQERFITVMDPSPTITAQRRWRPAETRTGDCRQPARSSWSHWKTLSRVTM